MAHQELDSIWDAAFPEEPRPQLYASEQLNDDGFRPLTDASKFLTDVSRLTATQIYARTANSQIALEQAQNEYLELEKIINHLKNRDPTAVVSIKNAQALPAFEDFEERKEATLYGYKYDSNRPMGSYGRWPEISEQERRDLRGFQDPFTQGGFVPNDRQYKGILNKAKDKRNPDNWTPIEIDGRKYIPRMAERVNEKLEYSILAGSATLIKGTASKPVTRSGTPDLEALISGGRDTPVNKRLRNTRFNGAKVPLTRDVSEAPSPPGSRASTPKRKRGDTPLVSVNQGGSPVKKPKLIVSSAEPIQMPPKRKHHNQYTKAKEKAALEALAAQKAQLEAEQKKQGIPSIAENGLHIPNASTGTNGTLTYPWTGLNDHEKRNFQWNNDTLLLAVREDPTWLHADLKKRQMWTKKIIESRYPVRTYSMYKKWEYWRMLGEDKRPRNKKKTNNGDFDDMDMDDGSVTATPSPLSRSFNVHDLEDDDELGRSATTLSPGPSRLGRGELLMVDYMDTDEDGSHNIGSSQSRRGSGSNSADSASQTINVSREETSMENNSFRRTTRAARKASA